MADFLHKVRHARRLDAMSARPATIGERFQTGRNVDTVTQDDLSDRSIDG
jgi:hypothetical protein